MSGSSPAPSLPLPIGGVEDRRRGCTGRAGVGVLASMRRARRNGSVEESLGEPTSNFGWNFWDVLRGFWARKRHARLRGPPLSFTSDFRAQTLDLEPLSFGQRPPTLKDGSVSWLPSCSCLWFQDLPYCSTLSLYLRPHVLGMGDPGFHPTLKPESILCCPLDWKVGGTVLSPNSCATSGSSETG